MSYKNKTKPLVIGLKFTRVPTNVSRRPRNISAQKNSSRSSTSSRSISSRSISSRSTSSNSRKGNKKSQKSQKTKKTNKKPPQKGRGSSSSGK